MYIYIRNLRQFVTTQNLAYKVEESFFCWKMNKHVSSNTVRMLIGMSEGKEQ